MGDVAYIAKRANERIRRTDSLVFPAGRPSPAGEAVVGERVDFCDRAVLVAGIGLFVSREVAQASLDFLGCELADMEEEDDEPEGVHVVNGKRKNGYEREPGI